MLSLRDPLLRLYATFTGPKRRHAIRQLSEAGQAPIVGLFYHRVADTQPNGWTMPVSVFQRQVDWLAARYDLISLAEARRRLMEGNNPRPAVVLTFDDGYGENCETAIPYLLRKGAAFTYFVSTQIVEEQTAFPHDLAAGTRLRPNTVEELRAMASAGVEVAAHTRSHPDLGQIDDSVALQEEVVGSVEQIEAWTGIRPKSFAFPFGQTTNLSTEAVRLAREAGVDTVCSAYGAYNLPGRLGTVGGVLHFRRVHADPEWGRFVNWMTFDSRKLNAVDPINDTDFLPAQQRVETSPPAEVLHG